MFTIRCTGQPDKLPNFNSFLSIVPELSKSKLRKVSCQSETYCHKPANSSKSMTPFPSVSNIPTEQLQLSYYSNLYIVYTCPAQHFLAQTYDYTKGRRLVSRPVVEFFATGQLQSLNILFALLIISRTVSGLNMVPVPTI